MYNLGLRPEGWNNETDTLEKTTIENYIKNKITLQGKVEECDKDYNLHINFSNGTKGIIPREEIEAINIQENGIPNVNLCTGKVNKFVQFKIKGINKDDVAILSRKEVQQEALETFKEKLEIGEKVIGIVKSIKPYGAFVEIGGGIVGLVHIEDISVARIKTPYERLKIGQAVEINIKEIDRKNGRINLSYKETLGTWEENAKKFSVGMRVRGIVRETEKNKNGIFIELLPNLVGMAEYKDGLQYGQDINVLIKRIDYDKKKIKLIYY
jgi:small subunit ribosomal protein S1